MATTSTSDSASSRYAVFVRVNSDPARWSFEGIYSDLAQIKEWNHQAHQENGVDSVRVFLLDY